jgi:hypothetical protein
MSFGKLGAMGRGFGHMGNVLGTAAEPALAFYWDTDLDSDSDDIAATALLVGLSNSTGVPIRHVSIASNNDYAATYMRVLLNYSARSSVPLGAYLSGSDISGGSASAYTQGAAAAFGHTETRSSYTAALTTLRTALARARNQSIKIIIGGTCTNIAALLASSADAISPLTGAQLVTAKVISIHVMGGRFDGDLGNENNAGFDLTAANALATFSGCPKYWAGYEVGALVNTRIPPEADSTLDPYKNGWDLFMTPDLAGRHASFDLMAVLNGALGTAGSFAINGPGDVSFAAGGVTTYTGNPASSNYYLTKTVSDGTIAATCETYINAAIASYHPLDTNPDDFSMGSQLNAEVSTVYTSSAITVAGLYNGGPAPVSIVNGEYRKNGGSWVSTAGTATNGDTFDVRRTSSASFEAAVSTTLTIGTKSSAYTITTRAAVFVYDTDADALFARHSSVWNDTWKMACNNFIVGAKAAGVWTKLDVFYCTADYASDSQRALLNWKQNLYNGTKVGTGTFNTDGWQGNGSTGYIESGYVFGSQNSAHLGCYSLTESNVSASDMGNSTTLIACRSTSNFAWRVNQAATDAPAVASSVGHFCASRTAAAVTAGYKDGVLVSGATRSSTAVPVDTIRCGGRGGTVSFSVRKLPIFHMGAGLTATEEGNLAGLIATFLHAVGLI